ncbi:MAG: lamin tail domain-containing protein [Candidatus Aureabacteria bacterium]|nr:lamin tail domain-containing protein [Candidatus Auribacterota bacterium]
MAAKKTYTEGTDKVTYERRYSNETAAKPGEARDVTAPEKVPNLYAGEGAAIGDIELAFTSPHENGTEGGKCMYYIIKYKDAGFTAWTDLDLSVFVQCYAPIDPVNAESLNLEGYDESTTYYFAIRAYDEYGNESPMSDIVSTQPRRLRFGDVVINEIAWAGIKDGPGFNGSAQQYVELYNTTENTIDLDSWAMNYGSYGANETYYFSASGDNKASSIINTLLSAHSYFLIENDSEGDTTNEAEDVTASDIELGTRRDLYLWAGPKYNYQIIDYVPFNASYGTWYAGTDADFGGVTGVDLISNRNSMEKIVPYGAGTDGTNWSDYSYTPESLVSYTTLTDNNRPPWIWGTPGAQNSVYVDREKDTDNDGMWDVYENKMWGGIPANKLDYDDGTFSDGIHGAGDDPDGDGFTNLQEFFCRTNPFDDNDYFRVESAGLGPNSLPTLIWQCWNRATFNLTYFIDGDIQPKFDILYADWSVGSQNNGKTFFETRPDWFNQTGAWKVLYSGVYNSWNSATTFFIDPFVTTLSPGDIRFYRVCISKTHLEGDWDNYILKQQPGYTYTTPDRRVSVVAPEIMMVQKHALNTTSYPLFGLAGDNPDGTGRFNNILGTGYFRGGVFPNATNINLWTSLSGGGADISSDFLSADGIWRDATGSTQTSSRTIVPRDGFRLLFKSGLPRESVNFFLASKLNLDPYCHEINKTSWYESTTRPLTPLDDDKAQTTLITYNYPVTAHFNPLAADIEFPFLRGTSQTGLNARDRANRSDWVGFYNRSFSKSPYTFENQNVIIYNDWSEWLTLTGPQWKYYLPLQIRGQAVGDELLISPGSPIATYQYWDPDNPVAWDAWTMGAELPYQNTGGGINQIERVLLWQ